MLSGVINSSVNHNTPRDTASAHGRHETINSVILFEIKAQAVKWLQVF